MLVKTRGKVRRFHIGRVLVLYNPPACRCGAGMTYCMLGLGPMGRPGPGGITGWNPKPGCGCGGPTMPGGGCP